MTAPSYGWMARKAVKRPGLARVDIARAQVARAYGR